MKTLTAPMDDERIKRFVQLFQDGVNAWIEAGKLLVEMVEEDPHVYDYIIQACPTLSAGMLGRFEQIGRSNLHPRLLLTSCPGFSKLQRLPISMQERYLSEPIPVIVHTEDGTDVLLVQAKDMTKEQAKQVFTGNRIRTEGEQKAFLMQQASDAARKITRGEAAWSIRNGRVRFHAGTELTAGEMATILAQLTK